MSVQAEQHIFQAETRQLLDLMIHSVYSNKDTFLRELISNSSDALDKLRLEALKNSDLDVDISDLRIELNPDPSARTLMVSDNGIGMSRDEVVDLIGTVAKSGTAKIREQLAAAQTEGSDSADLIGQFGIGFYATFMVADKVTLITCKAGESTSTKWESEGAGSYTIETLDHAGQGTCVILHLKDVDEDDSMHDYADTGALQRIVRTYSDFISFPIRMDVERSIPVEKDDESDAADDTAPEFETVVENQTLNSMKALWTRPSNEVDAEEYAEFYRHISHAWDEPLETIHMRGEGTFEYQALLFLPTSAPFDMFNRDFQRGIQLYVKRVFIMDDCEELIPPYLRFVKGVVDAQDLSLNVSREILQQDRQITMIRKRLVKKVLSTIASLRSTRPEDYTTFWKTFGSVIKEGLLDDPSGHDKILDIATFDSTWCTTQRDNEDNSLVGSGTTLADYVSRMAENQTEIYYLTGQSKQALENSPHLEAFAAKGLEVLFLTDGVDEVWVDAVGGFDGKPLRSIAKGDVDLSLIDAEANKDKDDSVHEELQPLCDWLAQQLSEDVKEVRVSSRLTTSPACVVGDAFDMTPTLERMYRASGQQLPKTKRILELNPDHQLVLGLKQSHADNPDSEDLKNTAKLVFGMAVLAEGGELEDPAGFARLLATKLSS